MSLPRWGWAACAVLLLSGPAHALYKVVGPDGKVTYTDRPPQAEQGKAQPVGRAADGPADAALPLALRTAAGRFPVALYTTTDCQPCDQGRALLRQRGVPFRERTATTPADQAAWQQQFGSLEAPVLTVGNQTLRGLQADQWHNYLDAAGYPRDARLPVNYTAPAPQPLAGPAAAPPAPAAPAPAPAVPPVPAPASGGIRF